MGSSHLFYEIGKKVEAQPVGRAYILCIHAGILDLLLKDCNCRKESGIFFRVCWSRGAERADMRPDGV
jgi:hypothetical protein